MEEKSVLCLNDEVLVVVSPAKKLLCEETFKHFTELRWHEQSASADFSLAKEVDSILTRLTVPHEVIPINKGSMSHMQLWDSSAAPAAKASRKAADLPIP